MYFKFIKRAVLLLFTFSLVVHADPQVYLSDLAQGYTYRYQLDGSTQREKLLQSFISPLHLNIDLVNGKLYWSASTKIIRSDLDGSNVEVLYDSDDNISAGNEVVVDSANGFIYWNNFSLSTIYKAPIDGSGPIETLYDSSSGLVQPVGLAIDTTAGKIYWSSSLGRIYRGNINGTGSFEELHTTVSFPIDIFLDTDGGKVYWSTSTEIGRGNLDGSGSPETLFNSSDGVSAPRGISFISSLNRVCFAELDGSVKCGSSDGVGSLSEIYDFSSPADNTSLQGLAINPSTGLLYVAGNTDIFSGSIDGTQSITRLTDLTKNTIQFPQALALDLANNYLYASDFASTTAEGSSIVRFKLDFEGSTSRILTGSKEILFSARDDGLDSASDIILDKSNGKIYWTDTDRRKIQRGNIDGSGVVEDLFDNPTDGVDDPLQLTIDFNAGFIYWTDQSIPAIVKGNINGIGSPTILYNAGDGVSNARAIALDAQNGFIYWSDRGTKQILRGDVNGTNAPVELFNSSDGVNNANRLILDLEKQKIYFLENDKILRANIDGSGTVEEIITGHLQLFTMAIVADTDDDGVPDEIDQCEVDPLKSTQGDCGCGMPDNDINQNDVSDCLLNQDIKKQIQTIIELVRSVRSTSTNNSKLNRRRKRVQKSILKNIIQVSRSVRAFIIANPESYNVKKDKTNITKLVRISHNRVRKVRGTSKDSFKDDKRKAIRGLRNLDRALLSE